MVANYILGELGYTEDLLGNIEVAFTPHMEHVLGIAGSLVVHERCAFIRDTPEVT